MESMMMENLFSTIEREIAIFGRRAEAIRIAYLSHSDFDRSTYLLLRQLEHEGPLAIKALADALLLDISTASRQTAALETKGFVEKLSDPNDARVKLLQITELGRQELLAFAKAREAFYAGLLEDWNEEECRQFGESLARFNRTMEERRRVNKSE
jgi:DNA-binding MarR family transcriptional regulator